MVDNVSLGRLTFDRIGWLKLSDAADETELDLADLSSSEGRAFLRNHIVYERRSNLRNDSKAFWRRKFGGYLRCMLCGFRFDRTYGPHGEDFIEMHHEEALSAGIRDSEVQDLKPLCSNCHRMVHRTDPMLTLAQMRRKLREGPYRCN